MQKKLETKIDPEDVLVLLGRFNLNLPTERRSETREVEEIVVHDSWKSYSKNSDGDLAIVVLDHSVHFTNFIRPICLVNDQQGEAFNHGFTVRWLIFMEFVKYFSARLQVGWGTEEHSHDKQFIHRKTHASKVNEEECSTLCPGCFDSKNVYCAKEDSSDTCNSDPGK